MPRQPADGRGSPLKRERVTAGFLIGVGYLTLTASVYWPAFRTIKSRFLSDSADGASFLWNYDFIGRSLLHGHSPFSTNSVFWPIGTPLAFHADTPLESIIVAALRHLVGFALAVNVVMLASVLASAVCAHLLAAHEGASRPAAFFAGAAFAFMPWRYLRIVAHHNLNHIWVIPLTLLLLLRFIDNPNRTRSAVVGAALGVAFLTDFTLFVLCAGGIAIVVLWHWRNALPHWRHLGVAAATFLILSAPLLVAMGRDVFHGEVDPLPGWGGADIFSADLLSWVIPPRSSRILGGRFQTLNNLVTGGERLTYPGMVVLVLALVMVVMVLLRHERQGVWVAMAGVFFVLSLGPFLRIDGHTGTGFHYLGSHFAVPLPYLAVHVIPLLQGLRVPARFCVPAILGLDILAALALTRLAHQRRLLAWILPATAMAILLVEVFPTGLPLQPATIPAAYQAIERDHNDKAVLELPLQWRDGFGQIGDSSPPRDDTLFMYFAAMHGHPVVGGMVARLPLERLRRLESIPLYRQVLALQHEPGFTDAPSFSAADLRSLDIGYVVYHLDRPLPDAASYIQRLDLRRISDDGTVTVWAVP